MSNDRPKKVILESPYAGDVERNVEYARRACRDSLLRGEAPLVSHLLYTQPGILDDKKKDERELGIQAGLEWGEYCKFSVFYADYGFTPGMLQGFKDAQAKGRGVEIRIIGLNPEKPSAPKHVAEPVELDRADFKRGPRG